MRRIAKKMSPVLARTGEAMLAVGFVLVFFLGFMAILGASFPEGTGLADLLQSSDMQSRVRTSNFELDLGTTPQTGRAPEPFVALLTEVSRKVKDKPPTAISWSSVSGDENLADRHSVQTFERSGATIAFDSSNRLRLGESSLVIVRRLEREPAKRRRRASLVVLGGELSGRISASGEGHMTLEIVTGETTSSIHSEKSDPTDFRVATGDDDSTTLDVYQGVAEITSGGHTIEVRANHSITLRSGGAPSRPIPLPAVPAPQSPRDGETRSYATVRPEVAFQWNDDDDADGWWLEIARDPGFEHLVHAGRMESPEFVHGQLPDGRLFWRVRAAKKSAMGPYSKARELTIAEDTDPPALTVEMLPAGQSRNELIVRGGTEPGAEVFVAGRLVEVGETGEFETVVPIEHGMRVIVVEAFDVAGNVAYRSERIDARYEQ